MQGVEEFLRADVLASDIQAWRFLLLFFPINPERGELITVLGYNDVEKTVGERCFANAAIAIKQHDIGIRLVGQQVLCVHKDTSKLGLLLDATEEGLALYRDQGLGHGNSLELAMATIYAAFVLHAFLWV